MATEPDSAERSNLPGRDALDYRIGTQSSFARSMELALGDHPALSSLSTRETDDPLVALVDAWACALDVLTFYQERIANEGFLGTAIERRSVLELARSIGYELSPGVAATTWLSVEVVPAPGGIDAFTIKAGTSAQSIPGPGELPQVFETVEEIVARPGWNSIPVVCEQPMAPAAGDTLVRLAGTDLVLQPGDPILVLVGGSAPWFDLRRVAAASVVQAVLAAPTDLVALVPAHTEVVLDAPLVRTPPRPTRPPGSAAPRSTCCVNAPRCSASTPRRGRPCRCRSESVISIPAYGIENSAFEHLQVRRARAAAPDFVESDEMSLSQQAAQSGNELIATTGGQDQVAQLLKGAYSERATSWADTAFPAGTTSIDLDQVYPRVVKSSLVALERPGAFVVRRVANVIETPRADFGVAARVTRLTFAAGDAVGFSPRTTSVLGQSEPLALAGAPLPDMVADVDALDLARAVPEIAPGRTLAITGVDADGAPVSEVATVKLIEAGVGAGPRLRLEQRLVNTYRRTSLRVLANVARATHGDSRAEILGSGDQRAAFQTMTLRQRPLTHVSASTPSGTQSTLAIWVAGVRWAEVPTLYGQAPDARVYTTRRADDGTVTVTFGDGRTGARLPSGRDNVVATYRVGIGLAAVLGRERISIPLARPLGLQNIVNPVAAAGADDPEVLASARTNAPLAVRTLGRIVSVLDYEDLARAFAGIGKARADVIWDGERRLVHLTVTGPHGAAIDPTSGTAVDLKRAIDAVRHAHGGRRDRQLPVPPVQRRRPPRAGAGPTAGRRHRRGHQHPDRSLLVRPSAARRAAAGVRGVRHAASGPGGGRRTARGVPRRQLQRGRAGRHRRLPGPTRPGWRHRPGRAGDHRPPRHPPRRGGHRSLRRTQRDQQPGGELMIDADVLWERLPAAMRGRDAETGGVLRALVEVLAGQAAAVADDIEALQDDWFIETCAEWVVPYIGELVGTVRCTRSPTPPASRTAPRWPTRCGSGAARAPRRCSRTWLG